MYLEEEPTMTRKHRDTRTTEQQTQAVQQAVQEAMDRRDNGGETGH
jgi:hypothetical protein